MVWFGCLHNCPYQLCEPDQSYRIACSLCSPLLVNLNKKGLCSLTVLQTWSESWGHCFQREVTPTEGYSILCSVLLLLCHTSAGNEFTPVPHCPSCQLLFPLFIRGQCLASCPTLLPLDFTLTKIPHAVLGKAKITVSSYAGCSCVVCVSPLLWFFGRNELQHWVWTWLHWWNPSFSISILWVELHNEPKVSTYSKKHLSDTSYGV